MTRFTGPAKRAQTFDPPRQRVANLLERYPSITESEAQQVVRFLKTGRHLDVGILTADERLRGNLDRFMEEHQSHFRLKWQEVAIAIVVLAAIVAAFWLATLALT